MPLNPLKGTWRTTNFNFHLNSDIAFIIVMAIPQVNGINATIQ